MAAIEAFKPDGERCLSVFPDEEREKTLAELRKDGYTKFIDC